MGSLPTQTIPALSGRISPDCKVTPFNVDKSICRTEAFRHFTSAMQNVILAVNYLTGKDKWQGAQTTFFFAIMPGHLLFLLFFCYSFGFYWTLLFLFVFISFLCGKVLRPPSFSLSSRVWRRSVAASLPTAETGTSFSASEPRAAVDVVSNNIFRDQTDHEVA